MTLPAYPAACGEWHQSPDCRAVVDADLDDERPAGYDIGSSQVALWTEALIDSLRSNADRCFACATDLHHEPGCRPAHTQVAANEEGNADSRSK